jgi:hypothetical protein
VGNKNCKKYLNFLEFLGPGTSYIDVKRSEKSKKVYFVVFLLFLSNFCIFGQNFLFFEKSIFFVQDFKQIKTNKSPKQNCSNFLTYNLAMKNKTKTVE